MDSLSGFVGDGSFQLIITSAEDFPNYRDTHRIVIVKPTGRDNIEMTTGNVKKYFVENEVVQHILNLIQGDEHIDDCRA